MEQPTSGGEAVARAQGVGVIGAQHPLAIGQGALVQRVPGRRLPGGRASHRGGQLGAARVLGCSAPSTPLVIGEG